MVELLVTIGVIGILAAVGFVSMLNYRPLLNANAAVRETAVHMRIARNRAIKDNSFILFRVMQDANGVLNTIGYCPTTTNPKRTQNPAASLVCEGFQRTYKLPDGTAFLLPLSAAATPRLPDFYLAVTSTDPDGNPVENPPWASAGNVNVRKWGRNPWAMDSGTLFQFIFCPDGSASDPVAMFVAPVNDRNKSVARLRAITVQQLSGGIRAWKLDEGRWN
jgi:type II secretory pathway pseudopilin PulG